LIIIFFLSTQSAFGQNDSKCIQLDKKQITAFFAKYQTLKTVHAEFEQIKTIKEFGIQITSTGVLTIKKPNYFQWEVRSPSALVFTVNDNHIKIITTQHNGQRITTEYNTQSLEKASLNTGIENLVDLVNLNIESLRSKYSFCKNSDIFFLTPRQTNSDFFKNIKFKLHNNNFMSKIEIEEHSGDTIKISFSKINSSKK